MANAPQRCPGCKRSLRDKSVPHHLLKYKRLFTLAQVDLEAEVRPGFTGWVDPECGHRWFAVGNHL